MSRPLVMVLLTLCVWVCEGSDGNVTNETGLIEVNGCSCNQKIELRNRTLIKGDNCAIPPENCTLELTRPPEVHVHAYIVYVRLQTKDDVKQVEIIRRWEYKVTHVVFHDPKECPHGTPCVKFTSTEVNEVITIKMIRDPERPQKRIKFTAYVVVVHARPDRETTRKVAGIIGLCAMVVLFIACILPRRCTGNTATGVVLAPPPDHVEVLVHTAATEQPPMYEGPPKYVASIAADEGAAPITGVPPAMTQAKEVAAVPVVGVANNPQDNATSNGVVLTAQPEQYTTPAY